MNDTKVCPICRSDFKFSNLGNRAAYSANCSRCGEFHITREACINLKNIQLEPRQQANILGWLYENQTEISRENIGWLIKLPTPSFHEKVNKILLALEKNTELAGQYLRKDSKWVNFGWCINMTELDEILEYMESSFIRKNQKVDTVEEGRYSLYKILPNGWAQLDTLKKQGADKTQCFVAMWFDEKMNVIYDQIIANGILDAGYKPHRVDQKEHNDKIDDEIIAQIRRSRFIVADFTGHRGGVYFEAGFAKGLGLEVIWTCKKEDMDKLHFDIRQYNCIVWEEGKLEDFRKRLQFRIESVFGEGTYQPQI